MRKSFFLITFMLVALWPSLAGCASGVGLEKPSRREVATPPTRDLGSVPVARDAGSPSVPPVGMDLGRAVIDAGRPIVDAGHPVSPPSPPPVPTRETCNGLDDDGDGSIDEDFLCPLGRVGELCVTSCGALGDRHCEAPSCSWSSFCYPREEQCDTIDNDCDGVVDEGCASAPPPPTDSHLVRIRLSDPRIDACPGGWKIRLWLTPSPDESSPGAALERSVVRNDGWSSISLWCDGRSPEWFVWSPLDFTALDTDMFAELSLGGVDLRSTVRLCDDPLSPRSGMRPIIMWDAARRGSCPP